VDNWLDFSAAASYSLDRVDATNLCPALPASDLNQMAQNAHSFADKVVIVTVRPPLALHLAVTFTPTRLTEHRVATGRSERNRVCDGQGMHRTG
jgi:hypothetical protein